MFLNLIPSSKVIEESFHHKKGREIRRLEMSLFTECESSYLENMAYNLGAVKAYERLENKRLIFPGSHIDKSEIEEALGVEYKENSWEFLGPFLALRSRIEAENYFVTQRGVKAPGLRILNTSEMADFAVNRIKINLHHNWKTTRIMTGHNISSLDEEERKRHEAVVNQAAQITLMQQKIFLGKQIL